MKTKLILIFCILISGSIYAQEKLAEIKFDQKLIDYGIVEFGIDGKKTFTFVKKSVTISRSVGFRTVGVAQRKWQPLHRKCHPGSRALLTSFSEYRSSLSRLRRSRRTVAPRTGGV